MRFWKFLLPLLVIVLLVVVSIYVQRSECGGNCWSTYITPTSSRARSWYGCKDRETIRPYKTRTLSCSYSGATLTKKAPLRRDAYKCTDRACIRLYGAWSKAKVHLYSSTLKIVKKKLKKPSLSYSYRTCNLCGSCSSGCLGASPYGCGSLFYGTCTANVGSGSVYVVVKNTGSRDARAEAFSGAFVGCKFTCCNKVVDEHKSSLVVSSDPLGVEIEYSGDMEGSRRTEFTLKRVRVGGSSAFTVTLEAPETAVVGNYFCEFLYWETPQGLVYDRVITVYVPDKSGRRVKAVYRKTCAELEVRTSIDGDLPFPVVFVNGSYVWTPALLRSPLGLSATLSAMGRVGFEEKEYVVSGLPRHIYMAGCNRPRTCKRVYKSKPLTGDYLLFLHLDEMRGCEYIRVQGERACVEIQQSRQQGHQGVARV